MSAFPKFDRNSRDSTTTDLQLSGQYSCLSRGKTQLSCHTLCEPESETPAFAVGGFIDPRIPRLTRLHLAGIHVEIELTTSIWDVDFLKERFDIGIHYGDGFFHGWENRVGRDQAAVWLL